VRARLVSGQDLVGTVTFVARSADPATRTFRVEAQAPNPGAAIRDGISAEILVGLPGVEAHLVPLSALTLDDSGRLGVQSVQDGRAAFMPVGVLRDDRRGAWVSGLPPELDIIVVGQDFVTDGRPVRVTYRDEAAPEVPAAAEPAPVEPAAEVLAP
jgi:membrane fusion protein, multidrug efflux system